MMEPLDDVIRDLISMDGRILLQLAALCIAGVLLLASLIVGGELGIMIATAAVAWMTATFGYLYGLKSGGNQ